MLRGEQLENLNRPTLGAAPTNFKALGVVSALAAAARAT